jgi:hypothetical protein
VCIAGACQKDLRKRLGSDLDRHRIERVDICALVERPLRLLRERAERARHEQRVRGPGRARDDSGRLEPTHELQLALEEVPEHAEHADAVRHRSALGLPVDLVDADDRSVGYPEPLRETLAALDDEVRLERLQLAAGEVLGAASAVEQVPLPARPPREYWDDRVVAPAPPART